MSQPVRVLFICSANLCRSVASTEIADRILRVHARPLRDWMFESAGTDVVPGNRLPPAIASAMDELEIPRRSEARPLSEPFARSADLILTAERHHRATVVRRYPFTVRYTFTTLEFGRLVAAGRAAATAGKSVDDLSLLDLARIGRSSVDPVDDAMLDIPDPVAAGTRAAMRQCVEAIEIALRQVAGIDAPEAAFERAPD